MDQFHKIYSQVMANLEQKLPSWLHYHSPGHTRYVLEKTIFIADREGVSAHDLFLLKLAALYHDTGFMLSREKHEEISCRIAREELEEYGIKPKEIEIICNMIMATQIPQKPKTKLENILADADLEYLGTTRFTEISDRLYKELLHYQPNLTPGQWNEIQIGFMSKHRYHTDYCKQYREPLKLTNLELIKKAVRKSG